MRARYQHKKPMRRMQAAALAVIGLMPLMPPVLQAYPLDADESGIRRLQGQRAIQARSGGPKLPPGALLSVNDIVLHLERHADWNLDPQERDPALQSALESVFASRDPSYGVVVVDFTDPANIRWAGVREERRQVPGSVGKVLCMTALFDGLRRAFPDIGERKRILREHWVVATDWVVKDSHKVPRLDSAGGGLRYAVIQPGDRFTLGEWVDHMISPSANAAGSIVWKEAILLRAYGSAYPPSPEEETAFFRNTPAAELSALAQAVINDALTAADLLPDELRVGNFWTSTGKKKVAGVGGSRATPRELARWLLRLEQGRLVDAWSSLEMKRYLYMTKRRYRYVYAPELAQAAVYFKSGSQFRCRPEEGFKCGKYMGNAQNAMNSILIVESPAQAGAQQKRYLVALISDVRKVNSAWDHSRLGAAIEEIVRSRQSVRVRDAGNAGEIKDSGTSE
ncbi:MAG: hypothetical protein KDI74_00455 [Gammaproteobacteria bacterium]|nr:hypothetical protein [Gammaproteobacteria bacterium]